jgi:type II secretory pathway component GspD/PulD (secretin)
MRTSFQILIIAGLMLGMAYAQEQTDSVQSVMKELNAYQGTTKPAAPVAATTVAVKPVAASAVEPVAPAVMAAEPAPVAVAAAPVDVPAVVKESRKQYVAGDYEEARKGFEKVLIAEPGNPIARVHMEKMAEQRQRNSEESSIEAVNKAWNGMVFRDYPLSAAILESLKVAEATNAVDVIASFPEIPFPDGAYALCRPKLKRLFVLNAPANLEKLEKVLATFGAAEAEVSAEQVKIEARFVEFNEGALQELGFNWSDASDGDTFNKGDWTVADGQDLFTDGLRTLPYAQIGALGLGETRATGPWRANRIEDMFNSNATGTGAVNLSGKVGGNEVDLLIKALDQTSGADVLSAPSVTTLSGQPAVITVGERHFYPETYEAGESPGTVLHVKYQDFKEKILGVEMTVTPTIKGNEIQMKINPRINELLGWQKFELATANTSYTYFQYRIGEQFEHETVIAQLPLFNRREVKTEVSVDSGSTIAMGGLIGEKTEAFSDRVPVLGSLPLVGRLFRSEGNRTVKRNLMIFVTASKVAPNGRIISERSFEK